MNVMRARTVLLILLAVNVLWAAAFLGYVQRARSPLASVPLASVEVRSSASNPAPVAVSTSQPAQAAASAASVPAVTNTPAPSNVPALRRPNSHQYGWLDVTNEAYQSYLADLRAAGCPEKQVRQIAATDVGELLRQRRLEHAIKTDPQWWKSEAFLGVIPMHNGNALDLDAERRELMTRLLGENWSEGLKLVSLNATVVTLTGAVLGGLPDATWLEVQEICARADERQKAYANAHPEVGFNADNIEVARLREQTRADLTKVLTTEQLEEFLLRYSQNATKLRQELAGIEVTREEFRRVFRVIDPLQHRMQVDYGSLDALSARQRDQLEALRDRAMKEALAPERYAQYVTTRDPIFKQAQIMASQSGLNALAIPPLHDMQKSLETRRNEVSQNTQLSPEEKKRALDAIVAEHQQIMQRILTDAKYRQ
jgi:hypothetical protein